MLADATRVYCTFVLLKVRPFFDDQICTFLRIILSFCAPFEYVTPSFLLAMTFSAVSPPRFQRIPLPPPPGTAATCHDASLASYPTGRPYFAAPPHS